MVEVVLVAIMVVVVLVVIVVVAVLVVVVGGGRGGGGRGETISCERRKPRCTEETIITSALQPSCLLTHQHCLYTGERGREREK